MSTFTPQKTPYLYWALVPTTVIVIVLTGIALTVLTFIEQSPLWALTLLALLLISFIFRTISYRKENYEFTDEYIIKNQGTILSDSSTKINIKNITNIIITRPWLEYKFFNTANISIQTAGSASSEITLISINNVDDMYLQIQQLMQAQGFAIKKQKILREDKPMILSVVVSLIGQLIVAYFVASYFSGMVMTFVALLKLENLIMIYGAGIVFVVIGVITFAYVRYQDMKQRVYRIYDDAITYSEGFLTTHEGLIPAENLADATITQGLIARIIGAQNVVVSSQGSGNQFIFSNMKNGKEMKEAIAAIAQQSKQVQPKKKVVAQTAPTAQKIPLPTTDFQIHAPRYFFTLVPAAVIFVLFSIGGIFFTPLLGAAALVFFVGVIGIIILAIAQANTRYSLSKTSIEYNFEFIGKVNIDFTIDKITGIQVKTDPFDWIFNTKTIIFWSIGSGTNITFQSIKDANKIIPPILAALGIKELEVEKIKPKFSLPSFVARTLPWHVFLLLLMTAIGIVTPFSYRTIVLPISIVAIFLLWLIPMIYSLVYHRKSEITILQNGVHVRNGIFWVDDTYTNYDNIKGIQTTKYPLSHKGTLLINIAGESIVDSGKSQRVVSNSAKLGYLKDISTLDEYMDLILLKGPLKDKEVALEKFRQKPILETPQDSANALFWVLVPSVLILLFTYSTAAFIPALLFMVVIMVAVFISIKVRKYTIEQLRIVKKWGVFYKKQSSLIFSKVDHINKEEGMTNKIFRNGSITIHTTGSSVGKPEMTIANISQYKEFYDEVQKRY